MNESEANDVFKSLNSDNVKKKLDKLQNPRKRPVQQIEVPEDSDFVEEQILRKKDVLTEQSPSKESYIKSIRAKLGDSKNIHRKQSDFTRVQVLDKFVGEFEIPCTWKDLKNTSYKKKAASEFFDSINTKGYSDLDIQTILFDLGFKWDELSEMGWKTPESFTLKYIEKVWEHLAKLVAKEKKIKSLENTVQTSEFDLEDKHAEGNTARKNLDKYKKLFGLDES